ncbi:guanine nucleotide binding protein, alpha subunit [Crucibulum laeve]|uniref:Guanine nucleotide binding protein, alpha subunit n=1 Tax=Crucibulum laeve TaxID=68775 RepID=A0A5C3MGU8_9AGAR|nr:guanine nucleotide binding protein, alpha subunit [Crucibulum laeve]
MQQSYDPKIDPLAAALAPPENETAAERLARERREEEAVQISKQIDTELKAAKAAMKRKKKAISVLVLGQSLSGKSTTIKNFQITYAHKSWTDQRASWRAVILLNLVRSVNIILDALADDIATPQTAISAVTAEKNADEPIRKVPRVTEQHKSLLLRLAPLRQIEKDLKALLGSGSSEYEDLSKENAAAEIAYNATRHYSRPSANEFCVRSTSGWKGILDQIRNPSVGKGSQLHRVACQVISGCSQDIQWLWADNITQEILQDRRIRLEDAPGFFLDDVNRIGTPNYEPSDEDIVRARLRTTGVQEYHFTLDRANATALDWIMYDVAGIRTSRAAWIPYFKDITAIIFMAPLSSFNETLAEDYRINRLEDTFVLWKTVCSSKLLVDVQIILFMNKIDILKRKLEQGIKVKDYIPEFRDKSNDYETVSMWFRRVFKRIYTEHSPPKRVLNAYFTSVVNTTSTAQTLGAVQAAILRNDITDAGLM